MDWLLSAPLINSAFASLGSMDGESYVVSPNALVILREINYKLSCEDQTLRTFRRTIGFGQNVRSDLIPLLNNAKDYDVLDMVIRILVNLTVPVECLFSVDVMYRTEVGRHTIFELNKLLYTSKEAFTDPRTTKSVVEYMKHILESDSKLTPQKCDQINNCLLLLRNILHIPETHANFIMPSTHMQGGKALAASMQNTILWNLFIQSIDKLLIYLMTCPQRTFWGVTLVQLIALIYKDQHVSMLQKLLNLWFEASLSESSDDNESNTSPSKQGSGGESSPMLTSDPTSDSSDNGGGRCKNEVSEDRRQALREETEATLQEVRRKGHEYQNSILRVPAEVRVSTENDISKVPEEVAMDQSTTVESCEEASLEVTLLAAIKEKNKQLVQSKRVHEKPDKTGLKTLDETDASAFIQPPALPIKLATILNPTETKVEAISNSADSPSKACKKVPHAGQLKLIKGKCGPQKRECPSSQSELSDCGYGTQVERESISTSSNDDDGPQGKPQHQKPPCNSKPRNKLRFVQTLVEKNELRRKKLVKRSKCSLINMKGLVQHTPTDEDISNLLKEFTVDFLLKGYGHLVEELHAQLLTNMKIAIDTSHFFWLVTYFLKFAVQLELDLEHVNAILNFDIISYLTYEGVTLCEQLDLNSHHQDSDSKGYLQRIHLVVTAIRECLQAIETYKKVTHLSEEDRERLQRLQEQISSTEDLRNLFVLLLRRFNPALHSKQYLQDLVVTNHMLLLIFDSVTKLDSGVNIKMVDHIAQFANLEVMHHYGILLEEFTGNGEFVNNCIFTMMHHIGGDMANIGALFQPVILKVFSRIWEADYELCDDWSDLIEYVIHKFINTPQKSSMKLPPVSLTELTKEHNLENTLCKWNQEEMDTLYWYYVRSKKTADVVGKIVSLFRNNGNKHKSRISIIQQLLQQDIITLVEYDDLMKFEDAEYQRALLNTPTSSMAESGIDSLHYGKPSDDIQILLDLIIKEKSENHLIWLQKLLLECCYVKLTLKQSPLRRDFHSLEHVMEPVAYHSILKNKTIPIVQWNTDQATMMQYQPFVLLLHKLGFQLPADAGSVFARIPDFWTADTMYDLAKKLGPMDKLLIKFDASQLEDMNATSGGCHHVKSARASLSSISSLEIDFIDNEEMGKSTSANLTPVSEVDVPLEEYTAGMMKASEIFAVPKTKRSNSIIRYTPEPGPTPALPNWLKLVMRSKCITTASENRRVSFDVAMSSISEASSLNASTESNASRSETQLPTNSSIFIAGSRSRSNSNSSLIGQNSTSNNNNTNINNNNSSTNMSDAVNSNSNRNNSSNSNSSNNLSKVTSEKQQQQQQQQQKSEQIYNISDDDSAMKSLDESDCDRNVSNSSNIFASKHRSSFSGSANHDSAYSEMVASIYENEIPNIEPAVSVASDLTQMYVSDEDEDQDDFKRYNH